jgi:hypothetical protein
MINVLIDDRDCLALTVGTRQPSSIQFDWNQVSQYALFVVDCILMAVSKGILEILFGVRVLILKQIESTNVIAVRYHLSHGPLFVQLLRLDWSKQILAQPQSVQPKVNGKELIDNKEDARLFRAIFVVRCVGSKLFAIVKCAAKAFLQQSDSILQFGLVRWIAGGLVSRNGNPVRIFANRVQGGDQAITSRRTKDVSKGSVQRCLTFVALDGVAL